MSAFDLDEDCIRRLAVILKETGLREIEYAEGDKRVRVASDAPAAATPTFVAAASKTQEQAGIPPAPEKISGTPVEAPMVGTVYLAPEPGAAPFVKTGDAVKAGDTLLTIEAMKVMNPIKAPVAGAVSAILVGDAKPVEFGETLLMIE